MTIFQCSDTLDGILCGVYDAWMLKKDLEYFMNICHKTEIITTVQSY